MSITIRSNVTKVSASFRRLARKFPGTVDFANRELGIEAQTLFEKTTATWTHQPAFTVEKSARGYTVGTDDEIYGYVDKGTRAHEIRPRRAGGVLRFAGPYHAKTKPNVIASYGGGRGRIVVWARRVMHPGTQPRNFSKIIRERVQSTAANKVRAALRAVTASEGFGI